MIYPWTTCETSMGDYSACFAAIDGDIKAVPAGKHIILFLQYKSFGTPDAVPAYLRSSPGAWCEGSMCGQYPTNDGGIAMIWNAAVADRLHAWFAALAGYYGPGGPGAAYADRLAGIVLPETSAGETAANPLTNFGYTGANYVAAIEANLLALSTSFPTLPIFQYINFLSHGVPSPSAALQALGDWALLHRNIGLGCPDVAGTPSFHPPGYDTLMNPKYQSHLPLNVAIEPMDYATAQTTGLSATYTEATGQAPNGMAAQFVVWWHVQGTGHAFTVDDVATYLGAHPNPNVALPSW
jgi:hypothetical protein